MHYARLPTGKTDCCDLWLLGCRISGCSAGVWGVWVWVAAVAHLELGPQQGQVRLLQVVVLRREAGLLPRAGRQAALGHPWRTRAVTTQPPTDTTWHHWLSPAQVNTHCSPWQQVLSLARNWLGSLPDANDWGTNPPPLQNILKTNHYSATGETAFKTFHWGKPCLTA